MSKTRTYLMVVVLAASLPAFGVEAVIEEIVVTANKREASVMDVPASVSAFSAETLDDKKIRSIDDLNIQVPNWNTGHLNGQALITVRGIGMSQAQGVAESAVAQHIDGVFQPRTTSLRGAYADLGSIEALRGPQGTLYGRNTTGGALNLNTAKPTEEFEGKVSVLYGDYDRTQFTGVVSGPISDKVLGRVSVLYDKRDEGYTENLQPGFDDLDDEEVTSAKVALRFLPSDVVTIDVMAMYEEREGAYGYAALTPPTDILFPIYTGAPFTIEPHKIFNDFDANDEREDFTSVITVGWDISENVSLKSTTGYLTTEWFQTGDSDGTGAFSVWQTTGTDSNTFSQELLLDIGLMDGDLDLLIGGFYYSDDLEFDNFLPLNFVDNLFGLPELTSLIITNVNQDTTAYAVFADATYSATDTFRIYGGVRWSYEEKDVDSAALQVVPICGFGLPVSELEDDWDDVSFRVGAQLDIGDNTMAYGQFQTGFRSGGFDASSCNDPYEPEEIDAFEVGLKATLADGRATLSASAFYYDYTDLQVTQIEGLQVNVENAASSEVYGVELEGSALLGNNLQLALRYAYLNAEYDEFTDCDTLLFPGNCSAQLTALGLTVFEDLSGNKLNRAPEHTIGISVDYTMEFGGSELTLRADATRLDDIYYRHFNRDNEKQDAYTLVNLFATFRPEANPDLLVRVFAKNVTDEEYINSAIAVGNTSFSLLTSPWGAPRTWGVELAYEF